MMDKIRKIAVVLVLCVLHACDGDIIYNASETFSEMPVIELYIDDDEYFNLLQNKTTKSDAPVKIFYNGQAGTGFIRSSGGGSRLHPRWSYRVELNDDFKVEGLNLFTLSSQSLDPSMIRTTVVSHIYALRGIAVFQSKHVFLKINNRDRGLYLILERIDQEFFNRRNIPVYELYKATLDSDLSFDAPNHPRYAYEKEIPEDNNYTHLFNYINAIDTSSISNIEQNLREYMDIDGYIQYHAISSMTNNIDAFKNNYYFYRISATAPYRFLPWDFDRSFGAVDEVGPAGENTLFNKLSRSESMRNKYMKELRYLLDNYFREDIIFPIIDSTAKYIREAYGLDPFLGAGGYNLDYQVSELKNIISGRIELYTGQISD